LEILKAGSLSPSVVLDLLLRGNTAIPGVEIIGKRIGSRGVVLGYDASTVYAVRVGTLPSEILLEAIRDLVWLKEEELLVQAVFPQTARPSAGVILAADRFPPAFSSLLHLFSFPCRLFRSIALGDPSFSCLLFESCAPPPPEDACAPEETTKEEERFFTSW
jgi:hypothetical protein